MFIKYRRFMAGEAKTFFSLMLFGGIFIAANAQMRGIPGGSFSMGTSNGKENESPAHEVALSPFSIDAYEVTRAQYDSCVQAGKCLPAHDQDGLCIAWNGKSFIRVVLPQNQTGPQSPVVCVTWYQARDYCGYKGKKLPSEAQWEYAALAGGSADYSWGNERPDAARCTAASDGKPKNPGSEPIRGVCST